MGPHMTRWKLAIIVLVALVLAATSAYYAWTVGLLMGKSREELAIEYVALNGPRGLVVCIRNTGEVSLTVEKLYIKRPDGTVLRCYDGYVFYMNPVLPEDIRPGETVIFEVEWEDEHGLEPGDKVLVRVLTTRGNVFEAEVNVK